MAGVRGWLMIQADICGLSRQAHASSTCVQASAWLGPQRTTVFHPHSMLGIAPSQAGQPRHPACSTAHLKEVVHALPGHSTHAHAL